MKIAWRLDVSYTEREKKEEEIDTEKLIRSRRAETDIHTEREIEYYYICTSIVLLIYRGRRYYNH